MHPCLDARQRRDQSHLPSRTPTPEPSGLRYPAEGAPPHRAYRPSLPRACSTGYQRVCAPLLLLAPGGQTGHRQRRHRAALHGSHQGRRPLAWKDRRDVFRWGGGGAGRGRGRGQRRRAVPPTLRRPRRRCTPPPPPPPPTPHPPTHPPTHPPPTHTPPPRRELLQQPATPPFPEMHYNHTDVARFFVGTGGDVTYKIMLDTFAQLRQVGLRLHYWP